MRKPTLIEAIEKIDSAQASRFVRLTGEAKAMATEGIVRHIRANRKNGSEPDKGAIREIIDDAIRGRKVFAEQTDEPPPQYMITVNPKGRRYP